MKVYLDELITYIECRFCYFRTHFMFDRVNSNVFSLYNYYCS